MNNAATKTCRICRRTRPVIHFAKQGHKYYKPYCKPCYKAYMKWHRRIEVAETASLTIERFRDEILPELVADGEAPWVTEDLPIESDPNEVLTEEESMARHNAIAAELIRTMPS